MRILFVYTLICAALISGFISPLGALLGYVWYALFRPQSWVWVDMSAFKFSLLLGVLLVLRSSFAGKWPNLTHSNSLLMLGLLAASLVAQTNAVQPDMGWYWLDFLGRLVLVTLLLISIVDTRRSMWLTILVISASLGFHTAKAGLVSILGGGVQYYDGLGGAFADNNGYALAAAMIMPLLWATARACPDRFRFRRILSMGFYLAVPLTAFTVISTFSRGGFLAMLAAAAVFIIFRKRKLVTLGVGLLLAVVALPFIPLPDGYLDRIDTITTYQEVEDNSALGRLHFWKVAWQMACDNPLGVGLYNYESNYDTYDFSHGAFGTKRAVHSSHFQILAETGFIGFILYGCLFINSFLICFRIRRQARNALPPSEGLFLSTIAESLLMTMTAFLAGGSFIALGLNDLSWLTFGVVAALDRLTASLVEAREQRDDTPSAEECPVPA